jgi:hypothetical protein
MHDTPLGWTMYLEDLERQAIRLRKPPGRQVRARLGTALAALLARMRAPREPRLTRVRRAARHAP